MLTCPVYALDRAKMLSEINLALGFSEDYELDWADILTPTNNNACNFTVAEAIVEFIGASFGGFL